MNEVRLSSRLKAAAELIPLGARFADVGTDHGLVPAYLAQSGRASFIAASDIRPGPLASAEKTAREYGVENRIDFRLTDGLCGMEELSLDAVLIAGMGGETIAAILRNAPWTGNGNVTLILQPQSKLPEMSEALSELHKPVTDARLVRDAGRLYIIMKASGRGEYAPSEAEKYAPRQLLLNHDALLSEYIDMLISRFSKTSAALASAGRKDEKLLTALAGLSEMKKETEKWTR